MPAARPTTRTARLALPAAAAVALLLAGCAGSPSGGELSYEDSPLSKYLGAVWGGEDESPEEMQARFEDENREREELIADCMTEEGFEYLPVLENGSFVSMSDDEDDVWDPESREWVAQWGYGALNWPGRDDQPSPDEQEWTDPNQEYVESLSESEMNAYYEALYGPQPTEEEMAAMEEGGDWEYDPANAGCQGAADLAVNGDDPSSADEHQPLMDAMSALWEETAEHPDLVELEAAWSSCMADAGEPGFAAQADAQNSIYEEQNAAWEGFEGEGEPDFGDLGEREIELALVDLDCREETDYRAEQLQVQFDLEERFIEEHKAELDAFIAAHEER